MIIIKQVIDLDRKKIETRTLFDRNIIKLLLIRTVAQHFKLNYLPI